MASSDQLTRTCGRHSRRAAVATCATCEAPACRECIVPTSVGIKCTTCIEGVRGRAAKAQKRPPVWATLLTFLVVAALLYATGLGRDGENNGAAGAPIGGAGLLAPRTVQIDGAGDVKLAGALSLPEGAGPDAGLPGVVILAGYGPTNRNGVVSPTGIPDDLYRDLSEAFADAGMVTLTYDKRGTGASVLSADQPLRFEDLVKDSGAALEFLAQRSEVDPDRLAVVGHGEGGLVAMQLAAQEPRVRGLGLISVPGRPLVEVIADDFSGAEHPPADEKDLRAVVSSLLASGKLPATIPVSLGGFFPTEQEKYLHDIFSIQPPALARDVRVPALVIRGGASTFATEADEAALKDSLPVAETFVADMTGPTLLVEEAPIADAEMPHDNIGVAPSRERSAEAVAALTAFLTKVTAG